MAINPTLTADAQRVLRAILDAKVVRGGELMWQSGFKTPQALATPVNELVSQNLIEVIGPVSPNELPFATFGIPPSSHEYLRSLLRRG
jgi:hypothetical protein